MNERETVLLKLFVKKELSERGLKADLTHDIEALKDMDFAKARSDLMAKLDALAPKQEKAGKTKKPKVTKQQVSEEEKKARAEQRKQEEVKLQAIIDDMNSKITCSGDIKKHYERLHKSVEMVANGGFNSSFIAGRAGTGKTYQITAELNELGKRSGTDYIEFSGEISEAYLYRFIFENNGKLIIFRDLNSLLSGLKSVNMLKGMTETHGTRIIRKSTYNREDEELPPFYPCKSNFIFEFNTLHTNGMKEDIEALFSRGDYVNLMMSFDDIKDIMYSIAKTQEEREITDYLLQNYGFVGLNTLNLRTQAKAFRIAQYAKQKGRDWKAELLTFLKSEVTDTRMKLYTLMGDKAVRTADLKRLLVKSGTDGISHMRTADRRINEWVLLGELFIVGFNTQDEDALEDFMETHKNYAVSLNPKNATNATTFSEKKEVVV